ncbi:molybdate ABC transporter permease subunit [Leptolyngbya sp. BC1307]|uniref:molybdate ABC transporter permease subunit n=1 Tax=Leptolyngbya sp. BC1307 TaxID=2029589 RepID=UPI000EFD61DF|nr:molybdate ABC transporter permease subunit [Leptolyngbya sp. BC1307]
MLTLSPLWISLRIAAIATLITCFLGIAAAHFMQRYRGRGRSLLDSLFLAPLVIPPTVLGFLLLLLLGKNGPLGSLLSHLGLNIVFTWYAAVLTATVVAFPLMYKTTLGAFEQIDSNLQQAARTLGASELTVFWRITLPLTLPSLLAGTTLSFARALGEFGATLMLAGNIPGRTQTLPMAIYFAVEGGDFREAALWSSATLILSLGAIILVNQFATRKTLLKTPPHSPFPIPHPPPHTAAERSRSPTPPCLQVNICKQLPGFTLAVNFTTDDQHPLGLLGASGAGKSLILRCIAGIETPDAGRIVLNGRVLFDSGQGIDLPSCDRKVGILFQNYALFPHLTVAQNVAFGLHSHPLPPSKMEAAVSQQLTAVHLSPLAQRYPHELSGGQQQRVALARSLANQPEVLLLDEPFSALDTHLRSQVEQQLKLRLQSYSGITLLVTHNLEEAYRICRSLLILESGHVAAHAPKHRIFEQPKTVSIARLTGCKNCSTAIARGPHQIEALDWQCTLTTVEPLPTNLTHIGIRAHQITFLTASADAPKPNTFPCWLAATSETPHRMTLFLKLNAPADSDRDYHLQAEIFKEKWATIKDQAFPWQVVLDPLRLILLSD